MNLRDELGCTHPWDNTEGEPACCPECLEAEVRRLRAIVETARKATRPGVAVSMRHPYWLDLVQKLHVGEAAEKARNR